MVRRLLGFFFVLISMGACSKNNAPTVPENLNSLQGSCGEAPWALKSAGFRDLTDLDNFLSENSVVQVNTIPMNYLVQFAAELKRLPTNLRSDVARVGYRILYGRGVSEDPTFPLVGLTKDGRSWSDVPGAGGATTRIVVNRLYEGHGSINLVLHEVAHAFDYLHSVSSDSEWKETMRRDQKFLNLMSRVCGSYCTENTGEAFAEAFAMYHSCHQGRALLSSSTEVFRFMQAHVVELAKRLGLFSPLSSPVFRATVDHRK